MRCPSSGVGHIAKDAVTKPSSRARLNSSARPLLGSLSGLGARRPPGAPRFADVLARIGADDEGVLPESTPIAQGQAWTDRILARPSQDHEPTPRVGTFHDELRSTSPVMR